MNFLLLRRGYSRIVTTTVSWITPWLAAPFFALVMEWALGKGRAGGARLNRPPAGVPDNSYCGRSMGQQSEFPR